MSSKKAIERIRARPPQADFDDVRAVLEEFGWTFTRQRGSHAYFTKKGDRPFSIPIKGGKVKRTYIVELCKHIGLDD
jgi:predicted RNA binding protein YcfA (HicA-like mRNA interferase family)